VSRRHPDTVVQAGIEALESGWLTMGPRTQKLEAALRERFGVSQAVATSSGTAALHLALLGCGVERGSTVLVPQGGPPSHAGAVEAIGARPAAYADPGNLDPEARAAVGCPGDLEDLAARCSDAGIVLVEDRRDAIGGPEAGAISILSFSSQREVSCGEGGAVLTNDESVADRVRSLRSHAMTSGSWDRHRGHAETYDVVDVGFNYRIDEIRAAMCEAALAELGSGG
jgi:dTDP-4-amino-4,6-dideoxygalactose transaminase